MDGARNGKIEAARLAGIYMMLGGMLALVLAGFGVTGAGATKPNPEHKVTLCHRTGSYSNPYVEITVDVASVLGPHGHNGHNGPIFFPTIPKHEKWGDIIPPFDFGPGEQYAGKNWPEGQAILDAGCKVQSGSTTTTGGTTTTNGETTTTTNGGTTTTNGETTTTTNGGTTTTNGETTTTSGGTTTTTNGGSTTTTNGVSTTTTTSPPVTVSSLGVTTTSTSVPATSTLATAPPPTTPGSNMPFTGSAVLPLIGVGLALIASGLGLVLRKRRLPLSPSDN